MKFVTGLLAAVLLLAGVGASHAVVRIAEDRGGRIGTYVDKYQDLRSSGEDGDHRRPVRLGLHHRARRRSPRQDLRDLEANLGFHAAWDFGSNGRAVTNPEATQMLYSMYPPAVRHWIAQRGGLTPHMIFLHGRQLMSMYRPAIWTPRPPPPDPDVA